MKVIAHPHEMAAWSAKARQEGRRIGFVPTMGALHQGHLALVARAKADCGATVCSVFVNPLQFNDPDDLANYPVRPDEDRALLGAAGCDALFLPGREALFSGFSPERYDLGGIDRHWEGPLRPGHFQGVVNVVQRLFAFVRPDRAYFGEKDRQQLAIVQWVARQQRWPEAIIPCPTVRESDGLALSSRNLRLSARERAAAPVLYRALQRMAALAFRASVADCLAAGAQALAEEPLAQPEYLGIAHTDTLEPAARWPACGTAVALIAARVGPVRLIDNIALHAPAA